MQLNKVVAALIETIIEQYRSGLEAMNGKLDGDVMEDMPESLSELVKEQRMLISQQIQHMEMLREHALSSGETE